MKIFFKKIITLILEIESRIVLKKYNPTIIAVTGSVGKTSTKDAIYTVLSATPVLVRKSEKSFNSEIGVPLTILGCSNAWNNPLAWMKNIFLGLEIIIFHTKYPKCLILEIGADHPGDIKRITKWLKPDIAVITKISDIPVHVEFFPSPEELFKEKSYLAKALKKNGTIVFSNDNIKIRTLIKEINRKSIGYGLEETQSTVNASNYNISYGERNSVRVPIGINFKLNYDGNSLPVNLKGVLGLQHIYPVLASATVGIVQGVILIDIINSLNNHIPPRGRMNILNGIKDSVIIDDTYNSSPDALREALLSMQKVECTGKKIVVLGDMMELGKFSKEEHIKAGILAHETASIVVTVGQRSKIMNGNVSFDSNGDAIEYIRGIIEKGDIILVKGSQSMRMEKIVKELLEEPYKAGELLVRQDAEWLAKK